MSSDSPATASGSSPPPSLPILLAAKVVKGFGRGSKMLGIPTANMSMDDLEGLVDKLPTGIWYGYAFLRGNIYKAVTSIGWNPYFNNEQKTVEPHLLHEFADDFYDEELRLLVCGFIRPERSFPSLDALVTEIYHDIEVARQELDKEEWKAFQDVDLAWTTNNPTFSSSSHDGENGGNGSKT